MKAKRWLARSMVIKWCNEDRDILAPDENDNKNIGCNLIRVTEVQYSFHQTT